MKTQKMFNLFGCVVLISACAGTAFASYEKCSEENHELCLNGVSTSVTNGASLRSSATEMSEVARRRSDQADAKGGESVAWRGSQRGLAAGDEMDMGGSVFGIWGNYSYNDFDSDYSFQGQSLAYDADANRFMIGIDRLFAGRFLLGVAGGYQSIDTDTDFNGGGQDSDGGTIAPYAAFLINDYFSLDLSGGYSWTDYDQDRISPVDGTKIRGNFDGESWFVATNLNWFMAVDNFVFGAKAGYLYTEEEQDAYTETGVSSTRAVQRRNIDLAQVVAGAEIAYAGAGAYEPFFMAEYRNDLSRDDDNRAGGLPGAFTSVRPKDDDEVQLNLGVRYYTTWGVIATFEYQRVEGRSHFDSDNFMFTLRAGL